VFYLLLLGFTFGVLTRSVKDRDASSSVYLCHYEAANGMIKLSLVARVFTYFTSLALVSYTAPTGNASRKVHFGYVWTAIRYNKEVMIVVWDVFFKSIVF